MIEMKKKYHDSETELVRAGIEQRGLWLYNFMEEAKKLGIDYEQFGRNVIFECGCGKGKMNFKQTDSLVNFAYQYQPESGRKAFDGKILELNEDKLVVESTYCPLVTMWHKLTDDAELVNQLCDIAMDGDRGIMSCFPQFEFHLKNTIPAGDGKCRVEVYKSEK